MSLARPWWLAALVLLVPLVILHLRRPALAVREVSSLAIWERLAASAQSTSRRLRPPRSPWILALQALALAAIVCALAGPSWKGSAPPATTVYVVDGSLWMRIGSRVGDARAAVTRLAATDPAGRVALVTATGTPAVVYHGSKAGLAGSTGTLAASAGAGNLAGAIALGAGLLGGSSGHMVVLHAPENAVPPIASARGQLAEQVVGAPSDDQGIFSRGVRCGVGPGASCEVVASVRNGSASRRVDRYSAFIGTRKAVTLGVAVPAHSSATVVLTAPAGSSVRLQLAAGDALDLDDSAWFTVPNAAGIPDGLDVLLVGDPTTARPLAQALSAAPGVRLRLRTPQSYRPADARASDLVVLDGWLPKAGLPPAPAVALIAPTRLPGGSLGGVLTAPVVSGTAPGSELLEGVDLRSLSVDAGAARVLDLPSYLAPVVWSPSGPLLAAGDDGRRRVAVLAFDPPSSNLTQLPAFPILARNLERWSTGWTSIDDRGSFQVDAIPATDGATLSSTSGVTRRIPLGVRPGALTGVAPGSYGVVAQGAAAEHRSTLTAALAEPAAAAVPSGGAIDLAPWARTPSSGSPASLTPFLIVLGLLAIAAEWLLWRRLRRR